MTEALLLIGCVIALCTLMGRFLDRLAVPSLLIFIALGMCCWRKRVAAHLF